MSETVELEATGDSLLQLKAQGLWPAIKRENLIDQLIAEVSLTDSGKDSAWNDFKRSIGWDGTSNLPALYADYSTTELQELAHRRARLQHFKKERFSSSVEQHFIKRKTALDRLTYSLIRVADGALARELYFRIHEDGEEFGRVAAVHSQGPEAHTCGVIGPVSRGGIHARLASILQSIVVGELQAPRRLGEWFIIVRLEKILPAVLDAAMQQQMLDELFEIHLQSRQPA